MGAIRKKLLSENHEQEAHNPLFEQLISGALLEIIRDRKTTEIDALLYEILGEGYAFDTLIQTDE